MNKNNYEAPEAELFVVRFEENFLQSGPEYGLKNAAGTDMTEDPDYTYSY